MHINLLPLGLSYALMLASLNFIPAFCPQNEVHYFSAGSREYPPVRIRFAEKSACKEKQLR